MHWIRTLETQTSEAWGVSREFGGDLLPALLLRYFPNSSPSWQGKFTAWMDIDQQALFLDCQTREFALKSLGRDRVGISLAAIGFAQVLDLGFIPKVVIAVNGEQIKAAINPQVFAPQAANKYFCSNTTGVMTMTSLPLITIPSVEIGALTLSRKLLDKVAWMLENPAPKTGVVRLHDEAQVIMSASSAALLTTTTLRQAVTRKRSEFWHPSDLLQFRVQTGEMVRDLKQGTKQPEDTLQEIQWRCVSGNGSWRLFTVQYQTFVDELGVAYQFSNNQGTERIEAPSDLAIR